ncbi:hypothetical protein cypCar_00046508, partial [Cyprinus carpio]
FFNLSLFDFTVLLLLCQHACFLSASGIAKKLVTCEGGSASLSCPSGFIHILGANYGRTDGKTCSAGRPSWQLSNVKCFQKASLHTMITRCNGRNSCSVSAVNSVFKDPCVGTYKYLKVSYECRPVKKGVIFVHHANYGRRDLGKCPYKLATTTHCYSSQTARIIQCNKIYFFFVRCNGKKTCHVIASNSVFSDPCKNVRKYLEVTYS